MQDNSINAMAQKYKEEMMRLYAKHPSEPVPERVCEVSAAPPEVNRLEHPPMPEIPRSTQNSTEKIVQNGKFLPPEQLVNLPTFDSGQGNYEFTEQQENFPGGEGLLKLEVTADGNPVDSAVCAVFRGGEHGDVLVATFCTDEHGETEVMTLPVIDGAYTVSVAKEGYYTVRGVEVPVFDNIKSIQPIELRQE
ncbi:MAG: carboxypeptidase-like regulatory domain-containing protein [Ruminococcus sp.]|nr:carboxypeptidase-like regulatory domain-containing protein [Ruminococcus sp.]MCM1382890.1 carboxypeptidase-like regulatory domain-containing protein [Muribaculaceae bacterium]MCM1479101.1 carboxypeptidase-like regulatory domain-containing protein [Muribaculaceae bacterium]